MNCNLLSFFYILMGLFSASAVAQVNKNSENRELVNSKTETTSEDFRNPTGTGVSFFTGLDTGFMLTSPADSRKETSKMGYQLGVKGVGSLFTNDIALDVGGGYLFNVLSTKIDHTTIVTTAGYFEASPRLVFGDQWQIGPVGQAFFGTDVTFGVEPAQKILPTVLAGMQVNFLYGKEKVFRSGIQFFTDINIHERRVYLAILNFQFGLPVVRPKTIITERRFLQVNENVHKLRTEKPVQHTVYKERVRFLFDSQIINFETDKAILSANSELFLRDFGHYLTANPDLWTEILIEGHTDSRGSAEHNLTLSQNRAASVRQALITAGINADKISAKGLGYSKPLDFGKSEEALARNRRVEMSFDGVTDANRLREAVTQLRENKSRKK